MGRLGSDVLALACIAGGALAGAGITAGLMARSVDVDSQTALRHCVVEYDAPQVVVRLRSSDGTASVTTRAKAPDATNCVTIEPNSVRIVQPTAISVIKTTEWTEEIGEQLDQARAQMEETRLRADEFRLQADELRLHADELRLQADEMRLEGELELLEGQELDLQNTRLAALEALLEQLRSKEADGAEATEVAKRLREALEEARAREGQSVTRIEIFRPDAAPEAPEPPTPVTPPGGGN